MKQQSTQIFNDTFVKKSVRRFAFVFQKLPVLLLFCLFAASLSAQELPDKIRGYKVYQAEINVKNAGEKIDKSVQSEAFVKIGEPQLIDVSLTGITFELSAEIDALAQSGKIDFLTFQDFRVNGLKVEVEEYKNPFEIKKDQPIMLPKPARIFLGASQTVRGALKELNESKDEWQVTGRVFVFGKFKKYGFSFKRVVPVEINLNIKNPLRQTSSK